MPVILPAYTTCENGTECSETSAHKIQSRGITYTCINTLQIRSRLFFLLTTPVKMEQSVPKRPHIKFRRQGMSFACINTLPIRSRLFFLLTPPVKMEQSVPKRPHIKFERQGITQKKEYNK